MGTRFRPAAPLLTVALVGLLGACSLLGVGTEEPTTVLSAPTGDQSAASSGDQASEVEGSAGGSSRQVPEAASTPEVAPAPAPEALSFDAIRNGTHELPQLCQDDKGSPTLVNGEATIWGIGFVRMSEHTVEYDTDWAGPLRIVHMYCNGGGSLVGSILVAFDSEGNKVAEMDFSKFFPGTTELTGMELSTIEGLIQVDVITDPARHKGEAHRLVLFVNNDGKFYQPDV